MNIAHLISSSGFFGAEHVVLALGRCLKIQGHRVFIGAVSDQRQSDVELLDRAQKAGLLTFQLKTRGKFSFSSVFQLKELIKKEHIDVLHTHNYKSDCIGLLAAGLAGIPVVATAHGFTEMTPNVSLYEKIDRWLLRSFFKRVVVVTPKILPDLNAERKNVIANGIDFSKFESNPDIRLPFKKKFGLEQNFIIGTVARFSKEKNQMLLLEAFLQLSPKYPQLRLVLVGDGPEEADLKDFVQQNNLEGKVFFTGILSDPSEAYQAFDIFALTSLTEGIPLTVIEAMAAKVPVVASRVGGVPELIEHENRGLLFSSGNVEELSMQIEKMITRPDFAKNLAENAYTFAKAHHSQSRMAEEYKEMYFDVLEETIGSKKGA